MKEQYEFCKKFGFGEQKKNDKLALLGFKDSDHALAEMLCDKITCPNGKEIIDRFYQRLFGYPRYKEILDRHQQLENLKNTQKNYLNLLGLDFALMQRGDAMEGLIDRADQTMYESKHAGRNCVRVRV